MTNLIIYNVIKIKWLIIVIQNVKVYNMRRKQEYVQLSLRLPKEMHTAFTEYAKMSSLYLNQVIVQMADMGWKTNKITRRYLEKIYDRLAQESFNEIFAGVPSRSGTKEEESRKEGDAVSDFDLNYKK